MNLFIDTETTGKADFKSAPDAEHQPRLVQLACLVHDDSGKEMAALSCIIQPEGYLIPSTASIIHGITNDIAVQSGVELGIVMAVAAGLMAGCKTIIAHNLDFDLFILTGEYIRLKYERVPMDRLDPFCTMRQMTDICCIQGPYGNKWPRLQEAYKHAFGEEFIGAHNAMDDVRACAKIYHWLKARPT